MREPDFQSYTLAMFCGERRIFISHERGLKPLVEWLDVFRGKYESCLLHDRVIGLAAARLIDYSGLISEAMAVTASRPARDFLARAGISLEAAQLVDNILADDGAAICPGEVIALETTDQEEFLNRIYSFVKAKRGDFWNCEGRCGTTPWCRQCKESRGLL